MPYLKSVKNNELTGVNLVFFYGFQSDSMEMNSEEAKELRKRYSALREHGLGNDSNSR